MKRILLVSPLRGGDLVDLDEATPAVSHDFPRALMPPVDLATIKALTPPGFHVDIWDESIRGRLTDETPLEHDYDLFGCTGYWGHIPWAQQFAHMIHKKGKPVVIGGPGVSGSPESCRGLFDVVFIGEAEHTWPQFLRDWEVGKAKPEYRQVQRPDLSCSPAPAWDDFADMKQNYLVGAVQTSRGCPFDCEFCDVIHLFGREMRSKPIATVLKEVAHLQSLGMRRVFFCDDNFIGRPSYTRDLVRQLIELNNSFDRPLSFGTQLTLNLARDDELLKMLADCNFYAVLIGVESPRQESLREANKPQNYKTDIQADIRKIQAHGITVRASMIVGFDHDDTDIFDETYEFLQEAGVPNIKVSMLKAFPGTPQRARFQREGRVLDIEEACDKNPTRSLTNTIPKLMTRIELMRGTMELWERIYDWKNFGARVSTMLSRVAYQPQRPIRDRILDDRAPLFFKMLSMLEPDGQQVATELLAKTQAIAPQMLGAVISAIVHQAGDRRAIAKAVEAIQKRIEFESSGDFVPTPVSALPPMPPSFEEEVEREAFAQSYEMLANGLHDRTLLTNALIEVWKHFIFRWSENFVRFEDYHYEYLRELCSRTIERAEAGELSDGGIVADAGDLSRSQLRRLAREVLVSVEQDLRARADRIGAEIADGVGAVAGVSAPRGGTTSEKSFLGGNR